MHVYELENVSVQYSERSQPRRWCINGTIVVTAIPIKANVITYLGVLSSKPCQSFYLGKQVHKDLCRAIGSERFLID